MCVCVSQQMSEEGALGSIAVIGSHGDHTMHACSSCHACQSAAPHAHLSLLSSLPAPRSGMIVFKLERECPAFATHGSQLYYIKVGRVYSGVAAVWMSTRWPADGAEGPAVGWCPSLDQLPASLTARIRGLCTPAAPHSPWHCMPPPPPSRPAGALHPLL